MLRSILFSLALLLVLQKASSMDEIVYPNSYRNTDSHYRHHIKWVTNKTIMPIIFEKIKNPEYNYDWFKLYDIDHPVQVPIESLNFIRSQSMQKSKLFMYYDYKTHGLLDTYESRLVQSNGSMLLSRADEPRELFTLAYLHRHYVEVQPEYQRVNVSCVAEFLLPDHGDFINDHVFMRMDHQALFKMSMNSVERVKSSSPGQQPKINEHLINKPAFSPKQGKYFPLKANLPHPNFNDFYGKFLNDIMRGSSQQLSMSHHARRMRRSKRAQMDSEDSEESQVQQTVDLGRLILKKIRYGPIILARPLKKDQVVTCSLNLLNTDEANLEYHASVHTHIKEKNYRAHTKFPKTVIDVIVDQAASHQQENHNFKQTDMVQDATEEIAKPLLQVERLFGTSSANKQNSASLVTIGLVLAALVLRF